MKTKKLTISAILTALAIIIPMIMPIKVVMPPFSATLTAHTPLIIAMFISPMAAVVASIGSAIGFLFSLGPVVAARAATHVFFTLAGAYMIAKKRNIFLVILVTMVIHALTDMGIVYLIAAPFGMADVLKGQGMAIVQTTLGVGTAIHHLVDFAIALAIVMPLSKAFPQYFERTSIK